MLNSSMVVNYVIVNSIMHFKNALLLQSNWLSIEPKGENKDLAYPSFALSGGLPDFTVAAFHIIVILNFRAAEHSYCGKRQKLLSNDYKITLDIHLIYYLRIYLVYLSIQRISNIDTPVTVSSVALLSHKLLLRTHQPHGRTGAHFLKPASRHHQNLKHQVSVPKGRRLHHLIPLDRTSNFNCNLSNFAPCANSTGTTLCQTDEHLFRQQLGFLPIPSVVHSTRRTARNQTLVASSTRRAASATCCNLRNCSLSIDRQFK